MTTWRDDVESEQLQLVPPLPPITPLRLKDHACGQQSPKHDLVYARVRCNRPIEHEGYHQLIRWTDFAVLAEWDDYTYRIMPKKG